MSRRLGQETGGFFGVWLLFSFIAIIPVVVFLSDFGWLMLPAAAAIGWVATIAYETLRYRN